MWFISLRCLRFRKFFAPFAASLAFVSVCSFGRPILLPVQSTPYDRQMERVRPVLASLTNEPANVISLDVVNQWMNRLRGIHYRYSAQWKTPAEIEAERRADCKGKALVLYEMLQAIGATNVRFVIGKYRSDSRVTHAWLEWETVEGNFILDPTFHHAVTREMQDNRSYIPLYAYEGEQKFQAFDTGLFTQNSVPAEQPIHLR